MASSVAIEPLMMLMKSIVPVRARVDAISSAVRLGQAARDVLAAGHPDPDDEVVADRRRIASRTSIEKRIRFVERAAVAIATRWLTSGDQNWSMRWP